MAITAKQTAFVNQSAAQIALSDMFASSAGATNPAYLVLTALDRKEYTAGASGATGSFTGNGRTLNLGSIGSDGRGAGIVFTYQAASGRSYNSTYGYLDQLAYNSSGSAGDVTNLSLFGTSNLALANAYASNAYSMMQVAAAGYLGSATVVTQSKFNGTVPSQANPNTIAAVAGSFVGQAWNMNGCWLLTSTIAADAGASLPVQSTAIGQAGVANGEWIVAYNGPAGQAGNWQSMVTAGEMIVFGTPGGGGHITTCVAGSGASAMLIDNITYVNGSGTVMNLANDGSSSDILIAAPHLASQEWSGVVASSVVIYELDTPIVTAKMSSYSLGALTSQVLSLLFGATDPANKAITQWQVYDTAATDTLLMGSTMYLDHAAATALTMTSLSLVSLMAGSAATVDMLEVRAYNGSYWGDWTGLAVTVTPGSAPATVIAPPVLAAQTVNQAWLGGKSFFLALPSATFSDPQGQALRYTATTASGQPLPSWLSFNAASDTFSGTAPTSAQAIGLTVTATNTSGLLVRDIFQVTVVGTPVVAAPTTPQTWTQGSTVSLALPSNTFTDPQGQPLTYTATQSGGVALPSWLTFNPATETFTGTAPKTASTLNIVVTATDTSLLSVSETFTAAIAAQAAAPVIKPGITVTAQTPNQAWIAGSKLDVVLPSNTFTDALGLKMNFLAYQVAGTNVTSWLRFNAATDEFTGIVPTNLSGTIKLEVIATDARSVSATDLFSVTFAAAGSAHVAALTVSSSGLDIPRPATALLPFHG